MAWRFNRSIFSRHRVHNETPESEPAGYNGFGAPLRIQYSAQRAAPGITENAGLYAYQTYLSPRWTAIGGGVPNKRDIGTAPPAFSRQGVLVAQVGAPGILAGAFVSGPLTNVTTQQSPQPIPAAASFSIPAA